MNRPKNGGRTEVLVPGEFAVVSGGDNPYSEDIEWVNAALQIDLEDAAISGRLSDDVLAHAPCVGYFEPKDDAAIAIVEKYGFEKCTPDGFFVARTVSDDITYRIVHFNDTLEDARALQFLAKLYLLARGDMRHDNVLPPIEIDESTTMVAFRLSVPTMCSWCGFPETYHDEYAVIKLDEQSNHNMVYECRTRQLESEDATRRLAALSILAAVVNNVPWRRVVPSAIEMKLLPNDNPDSFFAKTLIDAIENNRIVACPLCGVPKVLRTAKGKRFCKRSHQTRYNENAHKLLESGANVDEVISAFPAIKASTIRSWESHTGTEGR